MNTTLIDVLKGKEPKLTPVWFMRQAGRYLPEYRKVREQAGSFLNLCKTPELALEVTLQPVKRFKLDAAILFSDILLLPEAMGLKLDFIDNEGPKFSNPLSPSFGTFHFPEENEVINKLNFVFEAIKLIKAELKQELPLIGFCGSPFTLACYMLEGGSSSSYLKTKEALYNYPNFMHQLLNTITQNLVVYLTKQIEYGCDVIMIFDSWGGILSESAYLEFSLPYINLILNTLKLTHPQTPTILFAKGRGDMLTILSQTKVDCLGLDWTIDLASTRKTIPNITLQGNLDPALLAVGTKEALKAEVIRILEQYKKANANKLSGHIFNLGHGILPSTPIENVQYVVDLVHELTS